MSAKQISITVCTADGRPEAAGWMAAIVDSAADPIFSKDLQGRIVTWNKSAERMLGYSASEVVGQPVIGCVVPEEKADEERALLAWLARGERVEGFETVRKHKNGRMLTVRVTISPIVVDGQVVGAASVVREFADEAARQRNLGGAVVELETFAQRLPGEARPPVRVLSAFIQLVLDGYGAAMPPEGRALLDRASGAVGRIAAHIEKRLQ